MSEPIKVLMVLSNLRVSNGVASFAINYYRKLNHDEISMNFITYKNIESPYIEEIERCGGKVYTLPPVSRPVSHIKECLRILKTGKYDIIHDNTLLISLPLMECAAHMVKYRVLHSHSCKLSNKDIHELRNRLFVGALLKTFNYFAACSEKAGRTLFGGKNFSIIPNIINAKRFRYDKEKRERIRKQENCSGKIIVGTVGRLTDAKNPTFAIDCMELVLAQHPNVEYWWIGSGELDREVADIVASKGLSDRIRLFGSRRDIEDLYQAMDLYMLPSKSEGFGLSCLEAQAAGLFCVVSDQFPPEINVTGNVEFVSLSLDKTQWAERIGKHLKMCIDRTHASDAIKNSLYSDSTAAYQLMDFYRNILASRG